MSGSRNQGVIDRFLSSLRERSACWPDWLLAIEEPDAEEQNEGADAVAVTAERRILIHLENEAYKISAFNYLQPDNQMLVLLIFDDFSREKIARKALDFIERERTNPRADRKR